MKIAIHGSNAYMKRMPEAAHQLSIKYDIVDMYAIGMLKKPHNFEAILWNLNHEDKNDVLYGKYILESYQRSGIKVFPNVNTCWHYDNKLSQAHFLSALSYPIPETWIFYSKLDALDFLSRCSYPIIFKLSKGASSVNVNLIPNKNVGIALVNKMFGRGLSPYPPMKGISRAISSAKKNNKTKAPFIQRAKRAISLWIEKQFRQEREKGYVLLQEFIPGNKKDTRVTVIGQRAFCFERMAKENDFRVSGSGNKNYLTENEIPHDVVKLALEISSRFKYQVMSYDFIRRPETGEPVLLEMSFSSRPDSIEECHGYMDAEMNWHPGHFRPEPFILKDLLGVEA